LKTPKNFLTTAIPALTLDWSAAAPAMMVLTTSSMLV
jgi:hypothetical protein